MDCQTPLFCRLLPWLLVASYSLLNFLDTRFFCSLQLAPDEAHYVLWAKKLDLYYYSKGPVVAWQIFLTTLIFPDEWGVRFSANLGIFLFLVGLVMHLRQWALRPTTIAVVLVSLLSLPAFQALSLMMTIDNPLATCWIWALFFSFRLHQKSGRPLSALLLGVIIAWGMLAKQTMVLFLVSWFLYFARSWWNSGRKNELLLVLLGTIPAVVFPVIWNFTHDWVTVRHLLTLAWGNEAPQAASTRSLINLGEVLEFVGGQLGLWLGFWFLLYLFVVATSAISRTRPSFEQFCTFQSLGILLLFFLISFRHAGEVNWPMPAYISALGLMGRWWEHWPNSKSRRLFCLTWLVMVLVGFSCSLLLRHPSIMRPHLDHLARRLWPGKEYPIRQIDPTVRLTGWRELAQRVEFQRRRFEASLGKPILVAADSWIMPGELSFYGASPEHEIYSLGSQLKDRASQCDLWRPNPLDDPDHFQGQTFIYVGYELPPGIFRELRPLEIYEHYDGSILICRWKIWLAREYQGFPVRKTRKY